MQWAKKGTAIMKLDRTQKKFSLIFDNGERKMDGLWTVMTLIIFILMLVYEIDVALRN